VRNVVHSDRAVDFNEDREDFDACDPIRVVLL
jgi:hypothetical protein